MEEIKVLYMFENMALRKVFGHKWGEVTLVFRRMHNLYLLLRITALVQSSRRKCVVHILRNVICLQNFTRKVLVKRAYWGMLGVDGRIVLKLKLKELVLRVLTGSIWIGMLVAGRLCIRVVERMFFVSSECLDQLRDCDTVTQYCGAMNCVGVWQAVQT